MATEKKQKTSEYKSPLAGNSNVKEQFPNDEYCPASIIAYHIADLPPNKFADNNDMVPSVRYLFSNGTVRKWSNWMRISYNAKAKMMRVFTGFNNLPALMQDDFDEKSLLWNTPMKILCESKDGKYSQIIRVKPDENTDSPTLTAMYDIQFTPYKYVKAYGNLVNLRLAVLKTADGIKRMTPDDMIEPPPTENK